MDTVKSFIKENYKKFYFSILINSFLFVIFVSLFYLRYHTVDDVFMEMIVCGAFGKPDAHLIFSNYIIGFVLSLLYSLTDKIPWYGIMHLIMALFSFSTITYVVFNRKNKMTKFLVIAAILVTSYEAYTKVQFTKTASYLAVAGYFLIAFSLEQEEKKKNRQIFGILFLWLSFMIRPGMFFGVSAICLGILMPKVLYYLKSIKTESERRYLINLVQVGVISLILVVCSYGIDKLSYNSPEWQYYQSFNERRGQLYDVVFPPYEKYKDEYNKLGMDLEDCKLYDLGDMNDPDFFNIEKMEKVISLQERKVINLDEFVMFALRGYNTLFKSKTLAPFTILSLILLIIFVLCSHFKLINWISLLFSGLMALLVFEYSYYMHGWFDRTTISVMFALIMVTLYLIEARKNKLNLIVAVFVVIFISISSFYFWSEYLKANRKEWIEEYKFNHEVIDAVFEDKDHIYLSRGSFPMWKLYYLVSDPIRSGTMANYATYGDWMINAPFYIDAMKQYDIVNPYKDIINNKKAYLIGYADHLQPVIEYINKHYDKNAQLVEEKQFNNYYVYSVVSQPQ